MKNLSVLLILVSATALASDNNLDTKAWENSARCSIRISRVYEGPRDARDDGDRYKDNEKVELKSDNALGASMLVGERDFEFNDGYVLNIHLMLEKGFSSWKQAENVTLITSAQLRRKLANGEIEVLAAAQTSSDEVGDPMELDFMKRTRMTQIELKNPRIETAILNHPNESGNLYKMVQAGLLEAGIPMDASVSCSTSKVRN